MGNTTIPGRFRKLHWSIVHFSKYFFFILVILFLPPVIPKFCRIHLIYTVAKWYFKSHKIVEIVCAE